MNEEQRGLALRVAAEVRELGYIDGDNMEDGNTGEKIRGFEMKHVIYECGTPGCLTGWILWLSGERGRKILDEHHRRGGRYAYADDLMDEAAKLIGIGKLAQQHLFTPTFEGLDGVEYDETDPDNEGWISPKHAAACLTQLVEGGKVDWKGTRPELEENRR